MSLAIYLLEEAEAAAEGVGAEAALRQAADSVGALVTVDRFGDVDGFVAGLTRGVHLAGTTPSLLVISSHGKEGTGTHLVVGSRTISAFTVMHRVPARPGSMVVYVSACWGAYPDLPLALRWRSSPPPVVLGALVEIEVVHANEFQADLVHALARDASESELVALVERWNERLRPGYAGSAPFGIWTRSGEQVPEAGENGFAGKRWAGFQFKLVALQRRRVKVERMLGRACGVAGDLKMPVVEEDDLPDLAVVQDRRGQLWHLLAASLATEIESEVHLPELATWFSVTAIQKGAPECAGLPVPIGELCDVEDVVVLERKGLQHKFAWAVGMPGPLEDLIEIPASAAGPCVTCRWCTVGFVGLRVADPFERVVRAGNCACTKERGTCRLQPKT